MPPKVDSYDKLLADLMELQARALKLGYQVTARGINGAVQALGWEEADNTPRAQKALDLKGRG